MPRTVRNFWLETHVDGRSTTLATGPRGSDGGFYTIIKVRHKGHVRNVGTLHGTAALDGTLSVTWDDLTLGHGVRTLYKGAR